MAVFFLGRKKRILWVRTPLSLAIGKAI